MEGQQPLPESRRKILPLTFHQLETPSLMTNGFSQERTMQFQIDNMNCGGCAKSVTKAIQSVDGQAKVEIDLAGKQVLVASSAAEAAILASLNDAGYPPRRVA
jgi:copper chaperone